MITKAELAALAAVQTRPVTSIYLPTHQKGRETRQDPIRLKNALAEAAEQLAAAGHRRPEIEAILRPAEALLDDDPFWQHQERGLAVFAAPGFFRVQKLPAEVKETRHVGPRPLLKPMLPLLAEDGRFYCLAAKADSTRLYQGSRHGLAEVEADLPQSVAEIAAATDYEGTQHASPPARPRTATHVGMPAGQTFGDSPEEQRKVQLIEHLRRVIAALEKHLGGDRAPVILVGQPEVQGHLRALGKDIRFHEEAIQADPDALDAGELHARAYELVRPLFARGRDEALDRFRALAGSGEERAATDIEAVVSGAHVGRVDTLFLAEERAVWGSYDAAASRVQIDREPSPENDDLLDAAGVQTLLQGGSVYVLPAAEMPAEAPACAIFRY